MGLLLLSLLIAFTAAWWASVGLGAAMGLLYIVISLLAHRFALRRGPRTFMMIVVGGMTVRVGVALVAFVLILYLLPIEQTAFVGSFFGVFIVGLIVEVLYIRRAAPAGQDA